MKGHTWYSQRKAYKEKIREKFNHTCQLCGGYGNEVDHIIPFAVSHDSSESNLRVLCKPCNLATRRSNCKARMPLEQWYEYLKDELAKC